MRYAQTVPPHQIPTRQSYNPGLGGCHNKRWENNPPRALPSAHQGCYIGRDRRSGKRNHALDPATAKRRLNMCALTLPPHNNKPPQGRSRRYAHEGRHPTTKTPSNVTRWLDVRALQHPRGVTHIHHSDPVRYVCNPTFNKAALQHQHRSGKRVSPQPHGTKRTRLAPRPARNAQNYGRTTNNSYPKGGISAT